MNTMTLLTIAIILVTITTIAYATPMINYGTPGGPPTNDLNQLPFITRTLHPIHYEPDDANIWPVNRTSAALCSTTKRYTRDFYWALCRDTETSTASCRALLWHLMHEPMQACIRYRNEHVAGAASYQNGFWSSACQCHQAVLNTMLESDVMLTCAGNHQSIVYQWTGLKNGEERDDIRTMWLNAQDELRRDNHSDHIAAISTIVSQGPPVAATLLSKNAYQCSKTHSPDITVNDLKDLEPNSDRNYTWNLFWTIPPKPASASNGASSH